MVISVEDKARKRRFVSLFTHPCMNLAPGHTLQTWRLRHIEASILYLRGGRGLASGSRVSHHKEMKIKRCRLTLFQLFHTFKRDSKVVIIFPSCRIVQQLDVSNVDDRL